MTEEALSPIVGTDSRVETFMTRLPRKDRSWHSEPSAAVCQTLQSPSAGLAMAEVERRLLEFGPNLLPEKGPPPLWLVVLRQFISPLIYILVAAAVVSAVIGDVKDAGFIVAVLAINAVIGAYQELQAEKSSHALRKLLRIVAQVERDGEVREIEASGVVPGDVVWLESGNRVPADLRLMWSQGLEIDESLLTGESLAVAKDAEWIGPPETTLADRRNMAFAGALVSRGRAKGVVVATGGTTHVGQLALDVLGANSSKPPLLIRMERFTNYVAVGTVAASIVIGGLGMLLGNYTLVDTFFMVIALAVSAIPEGLPVAMTVALAVATTRMARRNVIVRRLTAVEGLGSCTLIATDKTGTLTCNELTVREAFVPGEGVYTVSGQGFAPLGEVRRVDKPSDSIAGDLAGRMASDMASGLPITQSPDSAGDAADAPRLGVLAEAAVLCNEADLHARNGDWVWRGDAVDVALLSFGHKLGRNREATLDRFPLVNAIPFESEHQFAATFHTDGVATRVCVKGAPERVLAMCGSLPAEQREEIERTALSMAARGLRVLAVAHGRLEQPVRREDVAPAPSQLDFLGFLGMIDPLRAGVKEAVVDCRSAGVEVSMITGDHRVTAFAIARELGLADREDQVVTAADIDGRSEEELRRIIRQTRVFARVTPRQKLQIVNAARSAGHFVAVTGDGVNDAPALRAANIGVAMGKTGTDVAREAAELVISDDNFRSIVGGVEEGRIAYDNVRKVIFLLVSTGVAELMMVLLSVVTGLPIPLLPVQLLWLNLVTNGIQGVALAFEPGEGDSLRRKPRATAEPVFNRLMLERVLITVAVVGCGGFFAYYLALRAGWSTIEARNLLLLVMVLFENFHVGNCRSETRSAFALSPLRSPTLFFGTLGAFVLHLAAMHLPFMQNLLGVSPLSVNAWLTALAASALVLPAIELHKWTWKRRGLDQPLASPSIQA
jgi:magnesium-transporting ATPase (P-type)